MFPWSLDIDTRGQLWIGCSAYEGESDSIQFNSIQFKALFRVDINHTYNTSSNELLKSTDDYNVHIVKL